MASKVYNAHALRAMQLNGKFDQYREYVENLGLRLEDYRILDDRMHETMRKPNNARKLIQIAPQEGGLQAQQYSYDELSHMSAGQIADLFSADVDLPDIERTDVHLPIVQKATEVNPRNIATFPTAMNSASKVARDLENEYIIQGKSPDNGTTYSIPGMYQGAGNDEATALDWGTPANIITSIVNTIALLNASFFYGPFNLTLNSIQYNQARPNIGTTAVSYLTWIKEQIGAGGDILIDDTLPDGDGMMSALPGTPTVNEEGGSGGAYAEYVMPVDWTHEEETREVSHNLFGRVYSVGRVILYDNLGISKMSAI